MVKMLLESILVSVLCSVQLEHAPADHQDVGQAAVMLRVWSKTQYDPCGAAVEVMNEAWFTHQIRANLWVTFYVHSTL